MGGSHHHALVHHGHSWLQAVPAHVKILATFLFVLAVVATPREAVWAFGAQWAGQGMAGGVRALPAADLVAVLARELAAARA